MEFVIKSSAGGPLPQEALRRIVEVVDACRGRAEEVFIVFGDRAPYDVVSVHRTLEAAREAAKADPHLRIFGPVAPPEGAQSPFPAIPKTSGTGFAPLSKLKNPVSKVVLLDANNDELAHFPVTLEGRLPDPQNDIEALFLTASSVDRFAIPYVTRVYGAAYAAAERKKWIRD